MRGWLAIGLVASLITGCGGGDAPDGPFVAYQRAYGGIVGGVADLRVAEDGHAVVSGSGCARGPRDFELTASQLRRLRAVLQGVARVQPRSRVMPSAEAPAVRIDSGGVDLHYVGFGNAPRAALPIIAEMDRLVALGCGRR
jgi:hypothetical protein